MLYLVLVGEGNASGIYVDEIIGVYASKAAAKRAAYRVDGVVKAVPYYSGSR